MTDSINDLYLRRQVCLACIRVLSETDDPRKGEALSEYNRQLAAIDKKIQALTGEIPPIVIGLKTADLTAVSKIT